MNVPQELLIVIIPAIVGAITGWFVAPRTAAQTEQTKRIDMLLDHQGQEIERLGLEVIKLREDFKEEQQLTETLKEESSRWRTLLQTALSYLRQIHHWQTGGHPPPPPTMPEELMEFLWEDL